MSSKVGQNQQQGRRTPLSLTGGKHSQHHQQQQNSKGNSSNLTKIQELKSDAIAAVSSKNGNNNAAKNSESNNLNQKVIKKAEQQNGNADDASKNAPVDEAAVSKTKNGTANGHKSNKNIAGKTEVPAKEKDNKDGDTTKDKPKKNEAPKHSEETIKANETVTQQSVQKSSTPTKTTNEAKQKEGATATTSNAASQEKDQTTATTSKSHAQKSATPTKAIEKGTATPPPTKSPANKSGTPSKSPRAGAAKTVVVNETSTEEMAPLVVELSPAKKSTAATNPTATSTPGKITTKCEKTEQLVKKDVSSGSVDSSAIPRVFAEISGRRSIRPIEDFTPSKYNSQFRESYRRINTELDVTSNTNTSMNVTVGSDVPNNSSFLSFSFFGRGRKREHTPPPLTPAKSQSTLELTTETTPTKRARLDVHGIFTSMSSPLTMLRSRFSKTTLESSTPTKPKSKNSDSVEDDVQNVSGILIEEVLCSNNSQNATEILPEKEATITTDKSPNKTSSPNKKEKEDDNIATEQDKDKTNESKEASAMDVDSDIQIKETPVIPAVGDPKIKQRGCTIM